MVFATQPLSIVRLLLGVTDNPAGLVHGDNREIRTLGVTEIEALAIYYAFDKFRPYCESTFVEVYSDHEGLQYLTTKDSTRLARWALFLQDFHYRVRYIPGPKNLLADAISRSYASECEAPLPPQLVFNSVSALTDYCVSSLGDSVSQTLYSPSELLNIPKVVAAQDADPFLQTITFPHENYLKVNGLIFHVPLQDDPRNDKPLLCIPESMRASALRLAHDDVAAGHRSLRPTLAHLRLHFWWPSLEGDTELYVRSCHQCHSTRKSQRPKSKARASTKVLSTFQRVAVDWAGPYTFGRQAPHYVLVIVDMFSGFVAMYPSPKCNAEAFRALFDQWVAANGMPREIFSDNAKSLADGEDFKHICKSYGITFTAISPYMSRSNGMVERRMDALKNFISDFLRYDQGIIFWVPVLAQVLNSQVCASTGDTPFFLARGRDFRSQLHNIHDLALDVPVAEAVSLSPLHTHAMRVARARLVEQALPHLQTPSPSDYALHDVVWHFRQTRKAGEPRYDGPFRVTQIKQSTTSTSADTYDITALGDVGGAQVVRHNVHPDFLKPHFGQVLLPQDKTSRGDVRAGVPNLIRSPSGSLNGLCHTTPLDRTTPPRRHRQPRRC